MGGLSPSGGPAGGGRVGDGGGCPGTVSVISHEATMNRSELYDLNSSQYRSEMIGLSIL